MTSTTQTAAVSRRRKQVLGGAALATAAVLALGGPISAALASSDGAPQVQTTETVKAQLKNDGSLDKDKTYLFSQIEATGNGKVSLEDPTSTSGLRNLDGWGEPSTSGGKASYDFTVDGEKRFRTVSDYTKQLPVDVRIDYTLDGKKVDPDDLAGRSGKLEVAYTITNTTAEPTQITYPDGHGKDVTETVDLVTPYVGQLALDLPDSFRNIASRDNRADQAGDGHGGRIVTWTMVLFEPIGQVEQKFGFTADVDDAAIPSAHMQIVPVSPENHPELKFGQDGFASGAETGRALTDGATQIDSNLIKLRDGAAKLLDGLTQLEAGAGQLSSGLADGVPTAIDGGRQLAAGAEDAAAGGEKVADGAEQVAAGNKQLADGLGALADGAGQLQTGAHQLSDGATKLSTGFQDPDSDSDLIDGSQALAGALGLISDGLGQLNSASSGLPAAKSGLIALKTAVDTRLIPAVGTTSGPCDPADLTKQTLLGCMQQIVGGVTQLKAGADQLADPSAGLPAAKGGVDAVLAGLNKNPSDGPTGDPGFRRGLELLKLNYDAALAPGGAVDQLFAGITTSGDCGVACQQTASVTIKGVPIEPPGGKSLKTQITEARDAVVALLTALGSATDVPTGNAATTTITGALNGVSAGLGTAVAGVGTGSSPGPTTLRGGLAQVLGGVTGVRSGLVQLRGALTNADVNGGTSNPVCNPAAALGTAGYCGLTEGLAQLVGGVTTAVNGVALLAPGSAAANQGAGDLADGIAQAGDGAAQLAGGAAQLSDGLDQVAVKVPDAVSGAQALAKGSAALADGSAELAAGLSGKLAPGANQLADGLAGLQAAADGSEQLADGLTQATTGNEQIVDGATQLQSEGTAQLVTAGENAATSYGHEYAVMQALNTKGAENAMPYGAPEGSTDDRGAYDITIQPVGSTGGMGSTGRGLVGIVVLGLGALAATLVRGRFA
jgi:putative membrane protein